MSDDVPPEADRVAGAPHPRESRLLIGQDAAERTFRDALRTGRLHHAWLVTGPRGVGKATLAWRIARYLLATQPDRDREATSLEVQGDDPVSRRVAALAEPRLFLLRRAWDAEAKRLKTVIAVDEVRRMKSFLTLSAADAGRRVVIVDTVDEMNASAANALLKMLEEPPRHTTLLLVSHRPSGLLPTIRSRCRELRCSPLSAADLARALEHLGMLPGPDASALTELSAGSAGEALRLMREDGVSLYARIVELLGTLPAVDRQKALALAGEASGRGNEDRYDLLVRLIGLAMARLARVGAGLAPASEAAPGESSVARRLAASPEAARRWAELHQSLGERARKARAVNLDPQSLLLDMVLKMNETAAGLAPRQGPS